MNRLCQSRCSALAARGNTKTASNHAVGISGTDVSVDQVRVAEQRTPIVVICNADIDTGSAAIQTRRRMACILQRLPHDLQHQSLLWIHTRRLARGDTEELGIELIHVFQECTVARCHLPNCVWILGNKTHRATNDRWEFR